MIDLSNSVEILYSNTIINTQNSINNIPLGGMLPNSFIIWDEKYQLWFWNDAMQEMVNYGEITKRHSDGSKTLRVIHINHLLDSVFSFTMIRKIKIRITETIKSKQSSVLMLEPHIAEPRNVPSFTKEWTAVVYKLFFSYCPANGKDYVSITFIEVSKKSENIRQLFDCAYIINEKVMSFNKFLETIISTQESAKKDDSNQNMVLQNIHEFTIELQKDWNLVTQKMWENFEWYLAKETVKKMSKERKFGWY